MLRYDDDDFDEPFDTLRERVLLDRRTLKIVNARVNRALWTGIASILLSTLMIVGGLWQVITEEVRIAALVEQRTAERNYRNCVAENFAQDLAMEVRALREAAAERGFNPPIPYAQPRDPTTGRPLPSEQDPTCAVPPPPPEDGEDGE